MENLIGIIIMILYIVVASAAGQNKKKAKQRVPERRAARFDQAFERAAQTVRDVSKIENKTKPSVQAARESIGQNAPEGVVAGRASMLPPRSDGARLRERARVQERQEGEEKVPGHGNCATDDGAMLEESPVYRSPIFNTEDQEAFSQDILRGVIIGEILQRPGQKRFGGRFGRSA